jgi:hypothetical protein
MPGHVPQLEQMLTHRTLQNLTRYKHKRLVHSNTELTIWESNFCRFYFWRQSHQLSNRMNKSKGWLWVYHRERAPKQYALNAYPEENILRVYGKI